MECEDKNWLYLEEATRKEMHSFLYFIKLNKHLKVLYAYKQWLKRKGSLKVAMALLPKLSFLKALKNKTK